MCGIFGAVSIQDYFNDSDFLRFVGFTDAVSHRGPDDSGHLAFDVKRGCPAEPARFDVFLGHRRLSIIDLSVAGHQPMTDGNGRWVIFNGEIFNFVELRAELASRGHSFSTQTDTEVILHVYDEFGEQGFARLNGMWAFAIVDLKTQRVVLSRDRFSMKPLYFLKRGGSIYFASDVRQLLPLLSGRRFDEEVMSAFLHQGLINHTTATFFSGITQCPPRTNFSICMRTGRIVEQTYWSFPSSALEPTGEKEISQRFRELFLDSVRIRLRSDVGVGVLLSGGLDSSAIAVACDEVGGRLHTYSIVSDDQRFSETKFIDAMSKECGIANCKIGFSVRDVLQTTLRVIDHMGEPFGSLSVVANFKVFERIKQQTEVRVLLSGQGGDEVLLGYAKFFFFHLRNLFRHGRYVSGLKEFLHSLFQGTVVRHFRLSEARRYLPLLDAVTGNGFLKLKHTRIPVWQCADLRQRCVLDIERFSIPALTHYEDRNSMAHSLEVRHPFLDHRLVEFLLRVPPDRILRRGWTKYPLRESFSELPNAVRWRRDKQSFTTPEEEWLGGGLSNLIEYVFKDSVLHDLGILDARKFMATFRKYRNGSPVVAFGDISRTLIAELWARRFLDEQRSLTSLESLSLKAERQAPTYLGSKPRFSPRNVEL
jgi:asparagine synthase (glutamine-hydrolysing)